VNPLERLDRLFPATLLARRNLSRHKLRSALAALGIVIGVLAIASLGMFGTTLRTGAEQQLGDIGNEIGVFPNAEAGVENLTDRDVAQIRRVVTTGEVVPVRSGAGLVERGRERSVVSLYGIAKPGALYDASDGRIPEPFRSGAVVGADVAERFEVVPGNTLTIEGESYRVVAILERDSGISLLNPNNAVVLPPDQVGDEDDRDAYAQVLVTADTGLQANESAIAIREELNRREQRVEIFELASVNQNVDEFFGLLNAFLIGIGSISLVVAGVSILNVMLMSTVERRQEIGVLRAIGVQRRQVIRMILAEAALLGLVGGLVGCLLAVLAGMVLNSYALEDPLATFEMRNLGFLLLAFAFALGTSLLSGLYPAWKAANERPVEALRK
jgi:putative ABC transport system permease protein